MRLSQAPPTLLSLLAVLLSSTHVSNAKPYPREESLLETRNSTIEERACAIPCGWSGQLCCTDGQVCFTDATGQAQCGSGGNAGATVTAPVTAQANNGQWQYYTTTFVRTDLVTVVSTYSSYIGGATSAPVAPTTVFAPVATGVTCDFSLNQSPCGSICCASGQYCQSAGQCVAAGGGSSAYYSSFYSQSYSAPLRPTTSAIITVTSTGSVTATVPFQTPVGTGGSVVTATPQTNNGLSGGAIAGIVIGVILGIILLLLLCAACCFKGLLDGLLALFGLGPKKRRRTREETYIEERHSHHAGGGGAAGGRTWFGAAGPSRPARPPPKKSGGLGGIGAVGAGLATLAIVLGLKRRRENQEKSSYGSGSSYYSTDYTSSSG
ncbi:hypothetical protein MMC16_006512 [Acarospora aff. strigata]|nr:hypothetical protein [Acarospora aff. strigata]